MLELGRIDVLVIWKEQVETLIENPDNYEVINLFSFEAGACIPKSYEHASELLVEINEYVDSFQASDEYEPFITERRSHYFGK